MYNNNPPTPSWSPPPIQAPVPQHAQRPGGVAFGSGTGSYPGSPQPAHSAPIGAGPSAARPQPNRQQSQPTYGAPFPPAQHTPPVGFSQPHHRQPQQGTFNTGTAGGGAYPQSTFQKQQVGGMGQAGGLGAMPATGSGGVYGQNITPNAYMGGPSSGQQGMGGQGHPQQPVWGSNLINEFQTSAAGQLGMQLGGKALEQAQENINKNLNRWVNIPHLKYYFNVSNSYVLNKIRLLLLPFRHQSWTRLVRRSEQNGQMEGYKPPREDLNAPDLYIPVMSFVTYILLVGIRLGLEDAAAKGGSSSAEKKFSKSFSPDVLGMTGTTAFFIVFFEVLFMKLGFYLLNVTTEVPFLDLVGYSGYKFIGVIAALTVKTFFPATWAVYGVFIYCMSCLGFFTLRSLKYIMLPEGYNTLESGARNRRVQFLFLVAGVQVFLSWLMVLMG